MPDVSTAYDKSDRGDAWVGERVAQTTAGRIEGRESPVDAYSRIESSAAHQGVGQRTIKRNRVGMGQSSDSGKSLLKRDRR